MDENHAARLSMSSSVASYGVCASVQCSVAPAWTIITGMRGKAMTDHHLIGHSCERDHTTWHHGQSRRRFLVGAGAFLATSVVPGCVVLGQGETRKVVDTHHH